MMLWEDFITVVGLLGCVALMLSFDPSLTRFGSQQAEAKGVQLLLDNLTQEQRLQYRAFGYFDVIGSDTGKRYRIHHGTSRNVVEIEKAGGLSSGRCFMPKGGLVAGDCMLAQKIALENYEKDVLQIALPYCPHIAPAPELHSVLQGRECVRNLRPAERIELSVDHLM